MNASFLSEFEIDADPKINDAIYMAKAHLESKNCLVIKKYA